MGGSSSDGYDAEYNSRMADLAETQMGMQEKAFEVWAGTDDNPGAGLLLEQEQAQAARDMLKVQQPFEEKQIEFGTKKLGKQSALMDRFYESIGKHDEGQAVSQASADVAGAISRARGNVMRDAQRRGIAPSAGGTGLGAAKLEVGAITGARDRVKSQNLNEMAMGMQI